MRDKILDKFKKLSEVEGLRVIGGENQIDNQDAFVVVLAKEGFPAVSLSLSGLELLQNSTEYSIDDLLNERFKKAMSAMKTLPFETNKEQ